MSFLYPLGLLGLIGIPILIAIYIIKSKYTEQTVSSTFLWILSERFRKRKRSASRVTGIVSLILQLLAITALSLLIAHPIITLPNSANEYCFILDASGSMQMQGAEKTRFEAAKEQISELILDATEGSAYTLVVVGDSTEVVFERLDNKEQAVFLLSEVRAAYNAADYSDALSVAQSYFNENPSVLTYLVTDTAYASLQNVQLCNVAADEINFSLTEIRHTHTGGHLTVVGEVLGHGQAGTRTVALYLGGVGEPVATAMVELSTTAPGQFALETDVDSFSSLEVRILEDDALAADNRHIFYDVKSEPIYNTLIVSERPFFLKSALATVISAKIDVIKPSDYTADRTGYGLYVFDSCAPEALPRDGAVWLVNPSASIEGAGFSIQALEMLESGEPLVASTSSASAVRELTHGTVGDTVHVTGYSKCGLYRNFTTLYTHLGNPVLFVGTNDAGCREVVFAFDLHNSNLPLLYDFGVLVRNFTEYSFPSLIDKTTYTCGDSAVINVPPNCDSISLQTPDGNTVYLSTEAATASHRLSEAGTYTVTVTVADAQREFSLFSAMLPAECDPTPTGEHFALQGERENGGFDGKFDPTLALFIALAILFLADWGVYCYDKYQLR